MHIHTSPPTIDYINKKLSATHGMLELLKQYFHEQVDCIRTGTMVGAKSRCIDDHNKRRDLHEELWHTSE